MSHSWTSSSSQCQVTSSRNAFHWRLWRRHKILTLLTRGCCYCCCLRRDSPETKAKAGGGCCSLHLYIYEASPIAVTLLLLLLVSGWEFNGSLKGCLQEHKCHSQTTLLPPKWSLVAAKYYDGRTTAAARQDGSSLRGLRSLHWISMYYCSNSTRVPNSVNKSFLWWIRTFRRFYSMFTWLMYVWSHGLRMPREEVVFTTLPDFHSLSRISRYGRSIFCLPHQPNFSESLGVLSPCLKQKEITSKLD